jgi:hypothetical protein
MVNSRYQRMDSILLFLSELFLWFTCYLSLLVSMLLAMHALGKEFGRAFTSGLFEMSIPFLFFGMAARH